MTTLRVLLHLTAQRDYELHSLDFNRAFLQGSLHKKIWPAPFAASSLALSLTRLAGSFTTPPRTVSSRLRTSHLTNPLPGTAPVQVAVGSGAAPSPASRGAAPGGVEPGGAGSEGAGSGGAEHEGVEPGGAESKGAESGGAAPQGAASSGGPAGSSPRLSSQQLCEWLVRCTHRQSGVSGAGDTGAGGAAVTTGAGGTGGTAATGPGGARTSGAGAMRTGGVAEVDGG
ncbi:unnamed protein product [Closterium sp. NIES-53]